MVSSSPDLEIFQEFARPLVESGRFVDTREVLQAAIDSLKRQFDEEAKLAYVIAAVEEGEASGIYEGDVFADIRARHGLQPRHVG